jgi:hypothetical protein
MAIEDAVFQEFTDGFIICLSKKDIARVGAGIDDTRRLVFLTVQHLLLLWS